MLTQQTIEKFYNDVKAMGLKFPVAEISRRTGISKGQVSSVLKRNLQPSAAFIKKFYESFNLENGATPAPPVPDTPLPGSATLQDLIAAKDELVRKAEDYAAKMEEHYKDLLARLKKEQENVSQAHETIRSNLVNLSQGQQELKEQMLVQTTSLRQQMNTLYVDLKQSVKAPPAPLSKGGKGLGVRTKNTDGKGKNC